MGILLYVGSADLRDDIWSWSLTPLTAKAVGTWLIGVGVIAGFIALVDDRADLPGNAVAQLVLGGVWLLGLARFGDEVDLGSGSGILFVAFLVSMVLTGLYGVALCLREGRFAPVLEQGGVPVEMRRGNAPPAGLCAVGRGHPDDLRVGRRPRGVRPLARPLLRPGGGRRPARAGVRGHGVGGAPGARDRLVGEVMGGPPVYTERHGGYEHMLARHRDLGIDADQRLRFVTLLSRAADEVDLPADPEFRAAIMGYAEWGTRLAQHNSQPGAQAAPHAPVPRWGWGVAPPYQP